MWDDYIQEELQDKDLHLKKRDLEDDKALARRMKGKQKKDLSKVNCFNCGEMGHFLSRCLMKKKGDDEKKKGKQVIGVATSAEIDALTSRLEEEDFAMISHLSQGIIDEDGWYMDSGATKHVTGPQEVFKVVFEWDTKLHMVLGDKSQKEIRGWELCHSGWRYDE